MSARTVAVNLLWLVPGDVGGSEEATVTSLTALAAAPPSDLDLRLLVLEPFRTAHPDLVARLPTESVRLSGRSRAARVAGEATWLARRTAGVDLVHHAGGTAPLRRGSPYVLTLHDLQPLVSRATHSAAKRAYLASAVPRSLRGARRVLVPTDFVRRSVLERFGLEPGRVGVVPHGVAPHGSPTPAEELVARYDLDGPVVLYPAITYPHKNHRTLVEAFSRLRAATGTDPVLVLPGRPDAGEAHLLAQLERLGVGPRVRRPGRIPAADVAGLYQLATVVAVPSRYEGFGLPAVEAMVHGAPLVAADATALPEVVGDAGLLVHPDDVEGWVEALARVLGDPVEQERLRAAGRRRAERFSPAVNAVALAEGYRTALG